MGSGQFVTLVVIASGLESNFNSNENVNSPMGLGACGSEQWAVGSLYHWGILLRIENLI